MKKTLCKLNKAVFFLKYVDLSSINIKISLSSPEPLYNFVRLCRCLCCTKIGKRKFNIFHAIPAYTQTDAQAYSLVMLFKSMV